MSRRTRPTRQRYEDELGLVYPDGGEGVCKLVTIDRDEYCCVRVAVTTYYDYSLVDISQALAEGLHATGPGLIEASSQRDMNGSLRYHYITPQFPRDAPRLIIDTIPWEVRKDWPEKYKSLYVGRKRVPRLEDMPDAAPTPTRAA